MSLQSMTSIRREVEKLSSQYTDAELFGSPYYEQLLQAMVWAVCERLHRIPRIKARYLANDLSAYTDGMQITVNTGSQLTKNLPRWEQHLCNLGLVTHECCHVLFTDFVNLNPTRLGWNKNELTFLPYIPNGGLEVKEILDKNPRTKKEYVSIMMHISNTLEDMYIENRGYQEFAGLCSAGMTILNKQAYNNSQELAEWYQSILGGVAPVAVLANILLTEKFGYKPKQTMPLPEGTESVKELIDNVLDEIRPIVDSLKWEANGYKRAEMFNELFVKLFPLMPIREEESDESEDSSNSQSEDENSGCEINPNDSPIGDTSPVGASLDKDASTESKSNAQNLSKDKEAMEQCTKDAVKQVAQQQAVKNSESERKNKEQQEANELSQRGASSDFESFKIDIPETDFETTGNYNSILSEVISSANNLVRKIRNVLRDRKQEGFESGFIMGQKFNAKDVWHRDGKYMSREILPGETPDVAFAILVDESGSMSGKKIYNARRTTVLLEKSLRELKIPVMIVGHTELRGEVIINKYIDFDSVNKLQYYRLAEITERYNNTDGAAITYVSELLNKRPEKKKVLIVISDGMPCSGSFYSESPEKDTSLAIEKYRKKGLKIFGAILDQFSDVQELYGQKYCFDCRNANALETELTQLIKRYVLS